jgi:hypothetical protein
MIIFRPVVACLAFQEDLERVRIFVSGSAGEKPGLQWA